MPRKAGWWWPWVAGAGIAALIVGSCVGVPKHIEPESGRPATVEVPPMDEKGRPRYTDPKSSCGEFLTAKSSGQDTSAIEKECRTDCASLVVYGALQADEYWKGQGRNRAIAAGSAFGLGWLLGIC